MQLKKNIFIYAFALIAGLVLFAAIASETNVFIRLEKSPVEETNLNKTVGVSFKTERASYLLGTKSIRVTLTNLTDTRMTSGEEYSIEIYKSQEWYVVPFRKTVSFTLVLWLLNQDIPFKQTLKLTDLNYHLSKGKYRVVKGVWGGSVPCVSAEFALT